MCDTYLVLLISTKKRS